MNWKERIDQAKKNGHFTIEDEQLANYWDSCAVGELHIFDNIELNYDNPLIYEKQCLILERLDKLGMDFFRNVVLNNVNKTQLIYKEIHKEYDNLRECD